MARGLDEEQRRGADTTAHDASGTISYAERVGLAPERRDSERVSEEREWL